MQVNSQDYSVRQYSQNTKSATQAGAVGSTSAAASEKAAETTSKTTAPDVDRVEFSRDTDITKMSDSDRSALVQSLKDDLNNQMSRFTNMMTQMFQKQGITTNLSQGNDFWKFMASGNYSVDAKTKADAQAAISEDGYWGVSQTSQRIFDFAKALAGDDPEKMKEMQAAVEKGFKQAEDAWGGSLPSICGDTHTAIGKLFDDYYAEKGATA